MARVVRVGLWGWAPRAELVTREQGARLTHRAQGERRGRGGGQEGERSVGGACVSREQGCRLRLQRLSLRESGSVGRSVSLGVCVCVCLSVCVCVSS